MSTIGFHIKLFRSEKGMTQEELAQQLFVSRQTVSNYENGKSQPDIDMLVKIASVLDTDINSLIYGGSGMENRRKKIFKFCLKVVVLIALYILCVWLRAKAENHAHLTYDVRLLLIVENILFPILALVIGGFVVEGIKIFFLIKTVSIKRVSWVRNGSILLSLALIFIEIGVWGQILGKMNDYLLFFLLLGGMLRLIKKN